MLGSIQPGDLFLRRDPQSVGMLDDLKHDRHDHAGIGRDRHDPQALYAELAQAAPVEQAAFGGQQAGQERTGHTAAAMDRHSAHGVIDVELHIQQFHHDYHQHAGDHAHHEGAHGIQISAAGGDAHQPRQRRVQAHTHVRLPVFDPGKEHAHHGSHRRGDGGVAQDLRQLGGIGGCGAVEAIPAEPEDKRPQRRDRDIMSKNRTGVAVLSVLADPGSQQNRTDQAGDAAHHMDHAGTGKIDEAQLGQPALPVPDPARLNGIDHGGDHSGVNAVAGEFGALRHGAGYDGCGSGAEHKLEEKVRPIKCVKAGKQLIFRQPDETEKVAFAVHDTVAQQHEHDRSDTKVHQVFHNDIAGILGTRESGFHHSKACLHKEDQNRANQIPDRHVHKTFLLNKKDARPAGSTGRASLRRCSLFPSGRLETRAASASKKQSGAAEDPSSAAPLLTGAVYQISCPLSTLLLHFQLNRRILSYFLQFLCIFYPKVIHF